MIAILSILAIAAAGLVVVIVARYLTYRGQRVVTCPETREPVGARIDGWLAATTELGGRPRYVISACTRWPERAGCDQACAPEIAASPRATLVRDIVARWYASRPCAFCGERIRDIHGVVVPAVRTREGRIDDWTDIAPENLPKILEQAVAVCARCDVVETFRRDHPQLVIERPPIPHEPHIPLRSGALY